MRVVEPEGIIPSKADAPVVAASVDWGAELAEMVLAFESETKDDVEPAELVFTSRLDDEDDPGPAESVSGF